MVQEDDVREIRREIERIKDQIQDIGHVQALQVRAMGEIKEHLLAEYFTGRGRKNKAKIYLAADGTKTVTEIAEEVGVVQPLVTKRCKEMYERGLLGWETDGGAKFYHPTVIERALHLSKDLEAIADDS